MNSRLINITLMAVLLLKVTTALSATEDLIYVGPGGAGGCGGNDCEYGDIGTAENAENRPLSSHYVVFELYNDSEDERLVIDGWTTSEECYLEIRGADYDRIETGANKNVGTWSTERFRFNISGTYYRSIYVRENDVKLINLQIKNTYDAGTIGIGNDHEAVTRQEYVGNIIILDNDLGGVGGCFYFDEGLGSGDNAIVNNICETRGDGSLSFLTCKYTSGCGGGVTAVYNNTIVFGEPTEGYHYCFNFIDTNTILKNNLCQDDRNVPNWCARLPSGLGEDNDYNICSETTDTGGDNDQSGITDVLFEDKSNSDFHLDSNDTRALDAGTDLSSDSYYPFSTDIDGDARSGWSIGADD